MGLLSTLLAHARQLSLRRTSFILPRPTGSRKLRTRRFQSTSSSRSTYSPAVHLRPVLLEDGSHPYYPGTAFEDLELGQTINDECKPRIRMSSPKPKRVFKLKSRPNTVSSLPEVFLPPYLGSL